MYRKLNVLFSRGGMFDIFLETRKDHIKSATKLIITLKKIRNPYYIVTNLKLNTITYLFQKLPDIKWSLSDLFNPFICFSLPV